MKKIGILFFLVLFCLFVGRIWYWATDGFRLARIKSFHDCGKTRALSQEAKEILAQPYFYLGRGRQCYAFQSADEKYVIKFPRTDRYKIPLWLHCICKDGGEKFRNNTITRRIKLFNSFEISFDELKEDTALIAMYHVPNNEQKIEIIDRLGRRFHLPLANTEFILQKKMRLFKEVFQESFLKKDKQAIEKIFDQLLDLIVRISDKGILSKDGSFLNNFGFDDTRAYQIDIGSFYRNEKLNPQDSFIRSIHASIEKLRVWLLYLDPSLLLLLDGKLHPIYERNIPKIIQESAFGKASAQNFDQA